MPRDEVGGGVYCFECPSLGNWVIELDNGTQTTTRDIFLTEIEYAQQVTIGFGIIMQNGQLDSNYTIEDYRDSTWTGPVTFPRIQKADSLIWYLNGGGTGGFFILANFNTFSTLSITYAIYQQRQFPYGKKWNVSPDKIYYVEGTKPERILATQECKYGVDYPRTTTTLDVSEIVGENYIGFCGMDDSSLKVTLYDIILS